MDLKFTANSVCAAERALGKSFGDILAELDSDQGASLSTLRALVAAGQLGDKYAGLHPMFLSVLRPDEYEAGKLIDAEGVEVAATAVGTALRGYFASVMGAADVA